MISDVDDELVTLFKAHPNTVVLSALGGPRRVVYAPWLTPPHPLVAERCRRTDRAPAEAAGGHHAGRGGSGPRGVDQAGPRAERLHEAGVRIGVGTDGGGQLGDQFVGWTMHTEVENLVATG
jgi:hypothetical protein